MGSIPISSTNSNNDLGATQGGRDASEPPLCHVCDASPDQLRAGLEVYRAYPSNERFNAGQRCPIDVTIVLAGGEHSLAPLNPTVAESLRAHGWRNVSVEVIANSGHQVIDEQPAAVADLLERCAARYVGDASPWAT
jgi:pimeloyl-ACP methyl ester carboxylesterase